MTERGTTGHEAMTMRIYGWIVLMMAGLAGGGGILDVAAG